MSVKAVYRTYLTLILLNNRTLLVKERFLNAIAMRLAKYRNKFR